MQRSPKSEPSCIYHKFVDLSLFVGLYCCIPGISYQVYAINSVGYHIESFDTSKYWWTFRHTAVQVLGVVCPPPIPWHPRVLLGDSERKQLRLYNTSQISKSLVRSIRLSVYRYRIVLDYWFSVSYRTRFLIFGIVSESILVHGYRIVSKSILEYRHCIVSDSILVYRSHIVSDSRLSVSCRSWFLFISLISYRTRFLFLGIVLKSILVYRYRIVSYRIELDYYLSVLNRIELHSNSSVSYHIDSIIVYRYHIVSKSLLGYRYRIGIDSCIWVSYRIDSCLSIRYRIELNSWSSVSFRVELDSWLSVSYRIVSYRIVSYRTRFLFTGVVRIELVFRSIINTSAVVRMSRLLYATRNNGVALHNQNTAV